MSVAAVSAPSHARPLVDFDGDTHSRADLRAREVVYELRRIKAWDGKTPIVIHNPSVLFERLFGPGQVDPHTLQEGVDYELYPDTPAGPLPPVPPSHRSRFAPPDPTPDQVHCILQTLSDGPEGGMSDDDLRDCCADNFGNARNYLVNCGYITRWTGKSGKKRSEWYGPGSKLTSAGRLYLARLNDPSAGEFSPTGDQSTIEPNSTNIEPRKSNQEGVESMPPQTPPSSEMFGESTPAPKSHRPKMFEEPLPRRDFAPKGKRLKGHRCSKCDEFREQNGDLCPHCGVGRFTYAVWEDDPNYVPEDPKASRLAPAKPAGLHACAKCARLVPATVELCDICASGVPTIGGGDTVSLPAHDYLTPGAHTMPAKPDQPADPAPDPECPGCHQPDSACTCNADADAKAAADERQADDIAAAIEESPTGTLIRVDDDSRTGYTLVKQADGSRVPQVVDVPETPAEEVTPAAETVFSASHIVSASPVVQIDVAAIDARINDVLRRDNAELQRDNAQLRLERNAAESEAAALRLEVAQLKERVDSLLATIKTQTEIITAISIESAALKEEWTELRDAALDGADALPAYSPDESADADPAGGAGESTTAPVTDDTPAEPAPTA